MAINFTAAEKPQSQRPATDPSLVEAVKYSWSQVTGVRVPIPELLSVANVEQTDDNEHDYNRAVRVVREAAQGQGLGIQARRVGGKGTATDVWFQAVEPRKRSAN